MMIASASTLKAQQVTWIEISCTCWCTFKAAEALVPMNLKPVQEAPVPIMDAQLEMELEVVSKAHIYIQT